MGGRGRKGEVLDEGGKEQRIGTEMEEVVGEGKGEGVKRSFMFGGILRYILRLPMLRKRRRQKPGVCCLPEHEGKREGP